MTYRFPFSSIIKLATINDEDKNRASMRSKQVEAARHITTILLKVLKLEIDSLQKKERKKNYIEVADCLGHEDAKPQPSFAKSNTR